ncbi:hypothetical protein HJC23_007384 [Cyclotella cryptica]|uniref:Methyltransferase FkbM domain-containing protein n=1 Tax=Cyclotella cryptica TaxID=29204 RepID=A0ABD3Q6E0_9STRA
MPSSDRFPRRTRRHLGFAAALTLLLSSFSVWFFDAQTLSVHLRPVSTADESLSSATKHVSSSSRVDDPTADACFGISAPPWTPDRHSTQSTKYLVFYPGFDAGSFLTSYVSSAIYACLTNRTLKLAPVDSRDTRVFRCHEYFDVDSEASLCRNLEMDEVLKRQYESAAVHVQRPDSWATEHCPDNPSHFQYFLCDDASSRDEFIAVNASRYWGDVLYFNPHFQSRLSPGTVRNVVRSRIIGPPSPPAVREKIPREGPYRVCIHIPWDMDRTSSALGGGWLGRLGTCVNHLLARTTTTEGHSSEREVWLFTMHADVRRELGQFARNGMTESLVVRFASETAPRGAGGHLDDAYQEVADMFSMGQKCMHLLSSVMMDTYSFLAANLMDDVSVFPAERWEDGCQEGSEVTDINPVGDYWNVGNDVCKFRETTCQVKEGSNVTDVKPILRFFESKKNTLPQECAAIHSAVEIGTSNFDTIIQEMARTNPIATGLSADAMQIYINQLPNLKCWRKLATAVVGKSEDIPSNAMITTYFINPDDIVNYDLPGWLRGCNSVGRPHATGLNELMKRNLLHLMRNISVPVVSVEQLLDKNRICRMKRFKVDVEGFDGELLVAFSKWVMQKNWTCYADIVSGEFNELSDGRVSGDDANLALVGVGYEETVSNEFDRVWKYVGKTPARVL